MSGEEFYIGVVIASSASAVHSRRQWGWLAVVYPSFCFIFAFAPFGRLDGFGVGMMKNLENYAKNVQLVEA